MSPNEAVEVGAIKLLIPLETPPPPPPAANDADVNVPPPTFIVSNEPTELTLSEPVICISFVVAKIEPVGKNIPFGAPSNLYQHWQLYL